MKSPLLLAQYSQPAPAVRPEDSGKYAVHGTQPAALSPPWPAVPAPSSKHSDDEEDGTEDLAPEDQPAGVDLLAVFEGLSIAIASMLDAAFNQKVHHEFKVFVFRTALLSAGCLVIAFLMLIPLMIPVMFLDICFHQGTHLMIPGVLCFFLLTLPQVQLFVARTFLYRRLDSVFFDALEQLDLEWACHLQALTPESRWRTALRMTKKLFIVMLVLPCVFLLSRIPGPGCLVMPLFVVWHSKGWIGNKRAIIAAIIMLVPRCRAPCSIVLVAYCQMMVLGRALLEPYFRREKAARKQAGKIFGRNEALLIGFCFPLHVATSLPIIGPALFVIAQSMSPSLLVRMGVKGEQGG